MVTSPIAPALTKPEYSERLLTRRGFFVGAASGIALLGAGAGVRSVVGRDLTLAQTDIESTPPTLPTPTEGQSFGPTIASKAAELGYDQNAIFRFVADEVRYEPYVGALRGANGTLWGLAGNAVDKSLLLAALLGESQILYRFASGTLTGDGAARLTAAYSREAPNTIQDAYARALMAAYTPTSPDSAESPGPSTPSSANEDKLAQQLVDGSNRASDLASQRLTQMEEIISAALSGAGISLATDQLSPESMSNVEPHIWVQFADGPIWHDLDASVANSKLDEPLAEMASSMSELPIGSYHQITIRVIAEEVSGGTPARRDVVTFVSTTAALGQSPLMLGVAPPSAMEGLGATINQIAAGQVSYYPYIGLAGEIVALASTPVAFGTDGETLLGALSDATPIGGPAEGDLLGLWYAVDVVSPGLDAISIEREIFDRVGFVERQMGQVDLTRIPPVSLVTGTDNTQFVPELAKAVILAVGSGDIPATYAASAGTDPFFGLSSMGAAHLAFTGSLLRSNMLPTGMHAFIGLPQLIAFTLASADSSDPESPIELSADMLRSTRMFLPTTGGRSSSDGLESGIRVGILAQVAESVLLDSSFWGVTAKNQMTGGTTVAGLFAAAATAGIGTRVLMGTTAAIPDGYSEEATLRITAALAAGEIVIVPEKPVTIGDRDLTGWWVINPLTGHTLDLMENGRGYAATVLTDRMALRAQLAEDVEITKEVTSWMPWWRRVGGCVGAVALLAAATIDPTSINEGTFTTAMGAAKLALRVYSRSPGFLKDVAGCL